MKRFLLLTILLITFTSCDEVIQNIESTQDTVDSLTTVISNLDSLSIPDTVFIYKTDTITEVKTKLDSFFYVKVDTFYNVDTFNVYNTDTVFIDTCFKK